MYAYLENDILLLEDLFEGVEHYVNQLSSNAIDKIEIITERKAKSATLISTKTYNELLKIKELYQTHLNELEDRAAYASFNDGL